MDHNYESTRRSWNHATRNHNAHKGDQARFLRDGGDVLFPEELELLGDLRGKRLVHLQCNAGQDTLCLARRGATVLGVDLSDEAIGFARALSADSGIAASFLEAEVVAWLHRTDQRFDIAFASYGAIGWLPDLAAWADGVHRVLEDGGRLVLVEFHPLIWSWGPDLRPTRDDYFATTPFIEPVNDYVAESGEGLGAVIPAETVPNPHAATGWQHPLGDVVTAVATAGLIVDELREYPHSSGYRFHPALVRDGRRWVWPEGIARTPALYGLCAHRPRNMQGR
jgi:SAM-dependent methyltransferase